MAEDKSGVKDLQTTTPAITQNPDDIIPENIKKHPDWILSRILFEKFGILHQFHVYQLKCYMVACCNISIGGAVKVDADNRSVTFELYTDKNFQIVSGSPVPRSKFSWRRMFGISKSRYREEIKTAKYNLRTWTQRLLWSNAEVHVIIDGEKYG